MIGILGLLIAGGIFSLSGNAAAGSVSAQFSRAINVRLPNFFTGVDWLQVLANIINPQNKGAVNICKIDIRDVITTDDAYVLSWSCGGGEAPCTIYANGKVFSQVHGAGSAHLVMKQPAVFYTIRNNKNLPCNYQIAHKFQGTQGANTQNGTGAGESDEEATLTTVEYTTDDFRAAVLAHVALYDGSTIATTTILATDSAATTTIRTTVSDIISAGSDGVLTSLEEETLVADSAALTALGHGLELIKVHVTTTDEDLLWLRENDAIKDSGTDAIFRINGYKTITGGGVSQQLILNAPHRNDDSNTLVIMLREFVEARNSRALVIGTFTKSKVNPTGTGADSSIADDVGDLATGTATCTGIIGPGNIVANDLGIYYIYDVSGSVISDNLYFLPWGSSCPATVILHDETGGDIFDVARSAAFVNPRRIIADDRGGDEFWCQDLASDGTASGSPIRTDFLGDPFALDSITVSPDGTMMYAIGDTDLNTNTTDNSIYRFTINSDCTVSATYDTLATGQSEIDSIMFDAYGNIFFTQDDTAGGKTDIKYISNAAGGNTTIATLLAGNSPSLMERLAGHVLDDITVNALTITSRNSNGLGNGDIVISDDTGDEIYTISVIRDSDGYATGLNRTWLTDFNTTSNTIEGLVMSNDDRLVLLQEDGVDSGSIFSLNMYGPIVVDNGNVTDISRILGYQTISERLVEMLNTIHLSFHGYRNSDWTIVKYCGTVSPVTVSDGVNSPNKPATYTYFEQTFSDAFNGWNSCASDFFEIFPQEAQVPLGAQTNKQGEFIQATNTYIGVDTSDLFVQFESPFDWRSSLATDGTDGALRMRDAMDDL